MDGVLKWPKILQFKKRYFYRKAQQLQSNSKTHERCRNPAYLKDLDRKKSVWPYFSLDSLTLQLVIVDTTAAPVLYIVGQ